MAKKLLTSICSKFHNGVKKYAADNIGFKPTAFQHFLKGRPIKDFVLIKIRRLYGVKYNNNGYTDTELLDLLEADYNENNLQHFMDKYT